MKEMPSFFEYMNTRGKTEIKAKVDELGDNIDVPKPKAKEDPHNKKGKKPEQVKEYINASGKLVEKPTVSMVPDYNGPDPHAPQKAGHADLGNQTGSPSPYRAANSSNYSTKAESGLGDKGDKALKYEPSTDTSKDGGQKVVSSWPKMKTESFLEKTKEMSLTEFASYMIECGCGQVPAESIKHAADVLTTETSISRTLFEVKRNGKLDLLVRSILEHPEAYSSLIKLFSEGEEGSRRWQIFNQSMMETVGPPIGLEDEEDEEDDEDDENLDDMEMAGSDEDMEGPPEDLDSDDDMDDYDDDEDEDMDDEDLDDEEDEDDEDMDDDMMDDEENNPFMKGNPFAKKHPSPMGPMGF